MTCHARDPEQEGGCCDGAIRRGRIEPLPAEALTSGDSHGVRFVDQNPGRPTAHSFEQHHDHVAFKVSSQGGRRLTEKYFAELSRAVLKIAFECAYLTMEMSCSPRDSSARPCRRR